MKIFKNDINVEDKNKLEEYLLAVDHESAAQCFSGLYMWRGIHDFCWEDIDGYLCVEGHYRPQQDEDRLVHYMFPPIPKSGEFKVDELRKVIAKVQVMFAEAGEDFMIKRLPGSMKPVFEEAFPDAEIVEDRTYFDYVYSLEELVELRGKRFHGKKNHLNGFNKTYEHEIRAFDHSMVFEVLDLVDRINASRDDTPEDAAALKYERDAMVDALENAEALGLIGCGIYIDDRMEAFAIGGKVSDKMITEHIEKANIQFRGAYSAINHAFCVMAQEAGYTLVNREEDMGSENLRKSKLSYHPVKLVEKYHLYL
ncbi:MAG: DUF2156 domain-containing protein [Firmicutes bacterium]|nr:DUF2156 domain-containing protein [Bacillota bacterium]